MLSKTTKCFEYMNVKLAVLVSFFIFMKKTYQRSDYMECIWKNSAFQSKVLCVTFKRISRNCRFLFMRILTQYRYLLLIYTIEFLYMSNLNIFLPYLQLKLQYKTDT